MANVAAAVTAVEVAEVKNCSNPGCDQPGTKSCSACKTAVYCSVIRQTADWAHHKEECDGHLRKMGTANLVKAEGFHRQQNYAQALRYAEIAATKLKQLKDRRLETVEIIDTAFSIKFNALSRLGRGREALECIQECYTLWAMNHLRNPGSMRAALGLIESCIHNREYEDAERYVRHAYFMIAEMTDNFIPSDRQPWFRAEASYYLSSAIHQLAQSGGVPPAEKKKAGEEAIEHARKALELRTQLHGTETAKVAGAMIILSSALEYFNDVEDGEVLRLHEQAISIYRRVEGTSLNVAVGLDKLAGTYTTRAKRAHDANDLERCLANLELALPHLKGAARLFRVNSHIAKAEETLQTIAMVEKQIRLIHRRSIRF